MRKLRLFPAGLDALYIRMMEQIRSSEDADLYKQILAIVVTARRPISLWELTALVEMPVDISDNLVSTLLEMPDDISKDLKSTPDDVPDDLESLRGIIRVCGSFLTL